MTKTRPTAAVKATVPHEVEIELEGYELADLFWSMDAVAQADFFARLGEIQRRSASDFAMQLCAVIETCEVGPEGKRAMRKIGETAGYSE